MERILIIIEGTDRSKVVEDFVEEVNSKFGEGWEQVSGTLIEFIAPRKGGYRYAFAIMLERKP